MSVPAAPLAVAQVIARNIVPLGGILLLGWSARNVLVLYFVDTLLAFAVLFAGLLRAFAPPVTDDGWAARANGEVGMIGGGLFLAVIIGFPLFVPLIFMLGGDLPVREMLDDRSFTAGLVWQAIAAFWSYVGLHRALRHATPDQLRLKQRFALVFLRWCALVMVAYLGIGMLLGRHGAIVFVALYIGLTVWAEIAPDRFLRAMPGGQEADARAAPAVVAPAAAGGPRFRERRRKQRRH
jgi:hypothetical protein